MSFISGTIYRLTDFDNSDDYEAFDITGAS